MLQKVANLFRESKVEHQAILGKAARACPQFRWRMTPCVENKMTPAGVIGKPESTSIRDRLHPEST